jgi:hypothetical protein
MKSDIELQQLKSRALEMIEAEKLLRRYRVWNCLAFKLAISSQLKLFQQPGQRFRVKGFRQISPI